MTGRVLSLCWSVDDTVICSGDAKSTIRVWAMSLHAESMTYRGKNVSRISLQRRAGSNEAVLVWAVKLLRYLTGLFYTFIPVAIA